MTLQRRTNSITGISAKADELRSKYSPSQLIGAFPASYQDTIISVCRTVSDTSAVWSPMLGVMSEAFPESTYDRTGEVVEDMAVTWMKAQLVQVSAFIGVKEKMNDWQLKSLCQQIISESPETTMMEFILFCARLRSGKYEAFYGNVDPMQVLKSFDAFLKDKLKDYATKRERELEEKRQKDAEDARNNALPFDEVEKRMEKGLYPNLKKLWDGEGVSKKLSEKMSSWAKKKSRKSD